MSDRDVSQPGAGDADRPPLDEATLGACAPEDGGAAGPTPRKRVTPVWAGLLFLVGLMLVFVVANLLTMGGPRVAWMENNLPAALAKAEAKKQWVFLYLYEPGPEASRNEQEIFNQRWAREPLAKVVCCRVAVPKGDPLRAKYDYKNRPLMMLVDAGGVERSRVEPGVEPVSQLQFETYIGRKIENFIARSEAHGASQPTP
jgi:hypothetical protein